MTVSCDPDQKKERSDKVVQEVRLSNQNEETFL
jgi:hypothetical protein